MGEAKKKKKKEEAPAVRMLASEQHDAASKQVAVQRTCKLFIGGAFPRTESGRYYPLLDAKGALLANICRSSRKDFRNAVVAARGAQSSWAAKSAYNRGQILYRIAEIIEGRSAQFEAELMHCGTSRSEARKEVRSAIDRLVYFAGWSDKYQQVLSSVNPVASSHFSFSTLEPSGVVTVFMNHQHGLLGLVSSLAPIIVGGNSCIIIANEKQPLVAVSLAESIHCSDVPAGVVNILTGQHEELLPWAAAHMDVNALCLLECDESLVATAEEKAVDNLKRVIKLSNQSLEENSDACSPYWIKAFQEVKTTWHPIGE